MTLASLRDLMTEDIADEAEADRLQKDSIETLFELGADHFSALESDQLDRLLAALETAISDNGNDASRASVLGTQIALNADRPDVALSLAELGLFTVGDSETLEIWRDRAKQAMFENRISTEISAGRVEKYLNTSKEQDSANQQILLDMTAPALVDANENAVLKWLELAQIEALSPSISASCLVLGRAMSLLGEIQDDDPHKARTLLEASLTVGTKIFPAAAGNATFTILRLQALKRAEDWTAIIEDISEAYPDELLSDDASLSIMGWAAIWSLAYGGKGLTTSPFSDIDIVKDYQRAGSAIRSGDIGRVMAEMMKERRPDSHKRSILTATLNILAAREDENAYQSVIQSLASFSILNSDDYKRGFELFLKTRDKTVPHTDKLETSVSQPTNDLSFADQIQSLKDVGYGAFEPWKALQKSNLREYETAPETSLSVIENPGAIRFRRFVEPFASGAVLDLGCGTTALPEYLADFPKGQIAGIDPIASEQPRDFLFYQGLAEILPWDDNTFDRVIIGTSGEHFLDPDRVLDEAARVLKPGGHLLYWTAFVPNAKPYDPWSTDNAPVDAFHLFNFDEGWFEDRLYERFAPYEKVRVDGLSVFYACRQKDDK